MRAINRRILALEAVHPKPAVLPQWAMEAQQDDQVAHWLWDAANGNQEARQHLHHRYGGAAPAMIEDYSAARQRVIELDDC